MSFGTGSVECERHHSSQVLIELPGMASILSVNIIHHLTDRTGKDDQVSGPQLPAPSGFYLAVDSDLAARDPDFRLNSISSKTGQLKKLRQADGFGTDRNFALVRHTSSCKKNRRMVIFLAGLVEQFLS
jgi:hypothetical protein